MYIIANLSKWYGICGGSFWTVLIQMSINWPKKLTLTILFNIFKKVSKRNKRKRKNNKNCRSSTSLNPTPPATVTHRHFKIHPSTYLRQSHSSTTVTILQLTLNKDLLEFLHQWVGWQQRFSRIAVPNNKKSWQFQPL